MRSFWPFSPSSDAEESSDCEDLAQPRTPKSCELASSITGSYSSHGIIRTLDNVEEIVDLIFPGKLPADGTVVDRRLWEVEHWLNFAVRSRTIRSLL